MCAKYTPENDDITACGIPQNLNASKEWADKKVVLFAVPGKGSIFMIVIIIVISCSAASLLSNSGLN